MLTLNCSFSFCMDANCFSEDFNAFYFEIISKTEQALNGAIPTKEQLEKIQKELKRGRDLRSVCQVANIGVSLALLGLIIPIFTRRNTKHKHEQALKLAQDVDILRKYIIN